MRFYDVHKLCVGRILVLRLVLNVSELSASTMMPMLELIFHIHYITNLHLISLPSSLSHAHMHIHTYTANVIYVYLLTKTVMVLAVIT